MVKKVLTKEDIIAQMASKRKATSDYYFQFLNRQKKTDIIKLSKGKKKLVKKSSKGSFVYKLK